MPEREHPEISQQTAPPRRVALMHDWFDTYVGGATVPAWSDLEAAHPTPTADNKLPATTAFLSR